MLELIDSSPLGTAAGYGVNLPLDRDGVAADLGFERATLADMQGGSADENAAIARALLSGELRGPKRDVILLNAASE